MDALVKTAAKAMACGALIWLAACGGTGAEANGEGGADMSAGPCDGAVITVSFADGKTILDPKPRDEVLALVEARKGACPKVTIASYDGGDAETARMRMNHVSNLITVRAGIASEDKTSAVVEAPSDELKGKVQVSLSAE